MRKVIFILSFILVAQVSVEAQNRRYPRRQYNRVERQMERQAWRVDRMTDAMATTYDLTDKQKEQLRSLNESWVGQAKNYSNNRYNNRRNGEQSRRYPCYSEYNTCLGTPTLYKELRLKELESEITSYRAELKKIFTKKQYKAYEKQIEDGLTRAVLK